MPGEMIEMNNFKSHISFLVLALVLLLSGCGDSSLCENVELQRKSSGDRRVDYILMEKDCGATTSESKILYIVPAGAAVDDQPPVLVMDSVKNFRVQWVENKLLEISFDNGRVFTFTNFWQSAELDNFEYTVYVNLVNNKFTSN